jgi:hypothetical protein
MSVLYLCSTVQQVQVPLLHKVCGHTLLLYWYWQCSATLP